MPTLPTDPRPPSHWSGPLSDMEGKGEGASQMFSFTILLASLK